MLRRYEIQAADQIFAPQRRPQARSSSCCWVIGAVALLDERQTT